MMRISETVKHLIIINVIFWIATIVLFNKGINLSEIFAFHFPLNESFKPWQIITNMFMHATYINNGSQIFFLHILFNMFGIWMFGSPVEQILGKKKFIFFYISCGLGATILPLIIDYIRFYNIISPLLEKGLDVQTLTSTLNQGRYNPEWITIIGQQDWESLRNIFFQQALGASGCLMGLLVAFGMMFPNSELMLIFLPIPIKAKYFIPLILGYEIYSGVSGGSSMFGFNVGHFAHIGGALTGFFLMLYFKKTQFNQNRWDR